MVRLLKLSLISGQLLDLKQGKRTAGSGFLDKSMAFVKPLWWQSNYHGVRIKLDTSEGESSALLIF